MNAPAPATVQLWDIVQLFIRYPLRWFLPAVIVVAATAVVTQQKQDTWEASQAFVVRNDAAGNTDGPGKFRHSDELKALLETLLEISKSRSVLEAALKDVGPPAQRRAIGDWPSDQELADLGEVVKLAPPKGAEYGKTEVFYLKVRDNDRQRALRLAAALCTELESHFSQLRNRRAASMVAELEQTVRLARINAEATSSRLKTLEEEVGGDLSELRSLHQSNGGADSDLRRKSLELENELRQAILIENNRSELLHALQKAKAEPNGLLALPNGLLESQPSLKKLKDGVIDAQMRTATLLGTMSPAHPSVRAAQVSERAISDHFHDEIDAAMRGVAIDLRVAGERVRSLREQLAATRGRLDRLASLRVEYTNRATDMEQCAKQLNEAERKLVETRAAQESSERTSLLSRIDQPDTGPKPVGPGKTTLWLGGLVGGLVAGIGVLFLTTNPARPVANTRSEPEHVRSTGAVSDESTLATAATTSDGLSLKRVLAKLGPRAA